MRQDPQAQNWEEGEDHQNKTGNKDRNGQDTGKKEDQTLEL